jgi:hypothetical protein
MDPIEVAVARGLALQILKAHLDREHPIDMDSLSSFMEERSLLLWLARRGSPMLLNQMNGSVMTYLKDRGCAIYKANQPAGPTGPTLLFWRIWGDGWAILEGAKKDPGIVVQ